jgi:peptidoglycan/LPS O-acetylase OafA/YrhL
MTDGMITAKGARTIEALARLGRFECMLCGALAAWLVNRKPREGATSRASIYVTTAGAACLVASGFRGEVVGPLVAGVVFGSWIAALATADHSVLGLDSQLGRAMGQVSYGMYLYHVVFVLAAAAWLPRVLAFTSPTLYNVTLYGFAFGGTLAAARVSYHHFEAPILAWKRRFAVIESRGVEGALGSRSHARSAEEQGS